MPWSTTTDIDAFTSAAGEFLASRPVEHNPLLTEADHLSRRPQPDADQAYGWWTDDAGLVAGAFLRAPRHAPVLSPMSEEAVGELVGVLTVDDGVGCDVTTVDAVQAAWASVGTSLVPRHRLVVHRLDAFRPPAPAPGRPRVAEEPDEPLLDQWFDELMAANPGDPSDRAFVVTDPLADGRISLWEVDGEPVAMAGRTRVRAGMTRVGAVYAPSGDARLEGAVLAAATAAAADVADDVLVLAASGDREGVARLAALGYRSVRERIMLAPAP
ncbi:hypothetical protein [Nocardioides pelophilus]|uniref:hypothetical protein n=1 Tax=Nocardioides pelophilus TaxID=2172019 RepID=UPI001602D36B|nr:hypothetical protein [Nocardioides pelophilus]